MYDDRIPREPGMHAHEYQPERGPERRVEFRPRNDGDWDRITYVRRRGEWDPTGSEVVTQFRVSQPATESQTGP